MEDKGVLRKNMKHPFLKTFLWGAGIFGGLHLVICIYFLIIGGEALMGLVLIDFPLYVLTEKFLLEKYFMFVSFVFGTLGYAIIGGLIFSILGRIVGFLFKQK